MFECACEVYRLPRRGRCRRRRRGRRYKNGRRRVENAHYPSRRFTGTRASFRHCASVVADVRVTAEATAVTNCDKRLADDDGEQRVSTTNKTKNGDILFFRVPFLQCASVKSTVSARVIEKKNPQKSHFPSLAMCVFRTPIAVSRYWIRFWTKCACFFPIYRLIGTTCTTSLKTLSLRKSYDFTKNRNRPFLSFHSSSSKFSIRVRQCSTQR